MEWRAKVMRTPGCAATAGESKVGVVEVEKRGGYPIFQGLGQNPSFVSGFNKLVGFDSFVRTPLDTSASKMYGSTSYRDRRGARVRIRVRRTFGEREQCQPNQSIRSPAICSSLGM